MDRPTVSVEVIEGESAVGRLDDAGFVEEWARLHATCVWATVFQSFAFVDGWYRLHEALYEPVIVEGRDPSGRLVGLLTLARRRSGRSLVGAGDFHAEYQTWIADEAPAEAFLRESLRQLERSFPRGRLRLMYVPPTAPLGWTRGDSVWPRRIHLRSRHGGFIDLSDPARIEASLQKSHNRNRLNGLRRSGEVRLESIDTVDGLLHEIDEIAVLCDLRQGAVNDSLPFTNNPLKRPLHIEMMERGLLRVTILRVGSAIASAHLDVKNGDDVLLYLAAHAPRFARYSPGSLHILLLARQLATEGVRRFDLSPGGGYKDRYADHGETTYALNVRFGLADRIVSDLAGRIEAGATSVLSAAGQTPRSALTTVRRVRGRASALRQPRPTDSARTRGSVVFELSDRVGADGSEQLALDHLNHLLAYRSGDAPGHATVYEFLRLALHRLEAGYRVLTRMDGTRLVECWWLCRLERAQGDRAKNPGADMSTAAALLAFDPLLVQTQGGTPSGPIGVARLGASMLAIAPDAVRLVATSVDDRALVAALVETGATRVAEVGVPQAGTGGGYRAVDVPNTPESAPFHEDLDKKLAGGWPVSRSDA